MQRPTLRLRVECGAEQVDGAVDVAGVLHVHEDRRVAFLGAGGERAQVVGGRGRVDVESEMGQLDRDLRAEAQLRDPVQHAQVVVHLGARFLQVLQVLADLREDRPDPVRLQRLRRLDRGIDRGPRHEAPHRRLREPVAREVLRQPFIAGRPQQCVSRQGHRSVSSDRWAGWLRGRPAAPM